MTVRLTVAQALVRFLASQYTERDGVRQRLIEGCWGIFGHGNVAGVGQALLQAQQTGEADLKYYLARNEQAMVHASVGFARMRNRLQTFACTASIGPGSTNMVTGAALATINRIPVLLLPSDFFATRAASPLLQELEDPRSYDVSVNDAFKPVSRFWDRISRPEQLPSALLAAMRVLTDPAETGAVTLALPQDVQAEAHDWPEGLFAERTWHVPRPCLFDNVTTDMDVYRDEIFGPVLVVLRAGTIDEAIDIVNANPCGNGTAIFTSSGEAAGKFQRHVEVGMIGINVPVPVPMAFYSFGGWKDSLFGDTYVHGPEGVRFYTRAKAITSRWPGTRSREHHRDHMQFPTAV